MNKNTFAQYQNIDGHIRCDPFCAATTAKKNIQPTNTNLCIVSTCVRVTYIYKYVVRVIIIAKNFLRLYVYNTHFNNAFWAISIYILCSILSFLCNNVFSASEEMYAFFVALLYHPSYASSFRPISIFFLPSAHAADPVARLLLTYIYIVICNRISTSVCVCLAKSRDIFCTVAKPGTAIWFDIRILYHRICGGRFSSPTTHHYRWHYCYSYYIHRFIYVCIVYIFAIITPQIYLQKNAKEKRGKRRRRQEKWMCK